MEGDRDWREEAGRASEQQRETTRTSQDEACTGNQLLAR